MSTNDRKATEETASTPVSGKVIVFSHPTINNKVMVIKNNNIFFIFVPSF